MDLRDEIIESQKARADLFKWKIILVAAIGAAALGLGATGLGGERAGTHQYLLCLVPLVCVYTDVLCAHINLRIRVIGHFLRWYGNRLRQQGSGNLSQPLKEEELNLLYEGFAHNARKLENKPRTRPWFPVHTWLSRKRVSAYVFEDAALHFSFNIAIFIRICLAVFRPAPVWLDGFFCCRLLRYSGELVGALRIQ